MPFERVLTMFVARSFSQVRKLYSSSTRFRPPLIPDSTRNHPPAMNSRNTCIPFAQHLDALPLWILSGICSPMQKRTKSYHGPFHSATSRRRKTEHLNWYSNERGTCVVMVGDQAYLMKVMNLDTRLIQTKKLILRLLLSNYVQTTNTETSLSNPISPFLHRHADGSNSHRRHRLQHRASLPSFLTQRAYMSVPARDALPRGLHGSRCSRTRGRSEGVLKCTVSAVLVGGNPFTKMA